jgi:hypothetical protein
MSYGLIITVRVIVHLAWAYLVDEDLVLRLAKPASL